ncbi:indole-3-glycerol-phosphate synthase [Aureococcus anophagefferens]|nr:indole-3-glycerol-phosphate synthase [Aureococcus anophagefferens]
MRRVAWAVLAAAGAAAPRAVDVARYERQAARFMADAGGGRRLGGGSPSDGPADAIDPNWELVKKSLEGLMIKEVWLTLSTIAYYSRLSLSYQLDRFCGSDGQASAYKALIAEGMLPAAAGARMSQCNEIGRGLIWAQIESIGTAYYAPARVLTRTARRTSWRDVFAPHHVVFIVSGAGGRVDPDGDLVGTSEGAPVVAWANGTEHGNGTKYRVRAVDSASAVVADAARWFAGRDYEDDRLYVVGGAFVRSIALYFDVYQGPLDWHMVFVQDVACADFTYADPGLGRCEPCEWPYLSRSGVDCDMCVAGYYYVPCQSGTSYEPGVGCVACAAGEACPRGVTDVGVCEPCPAHATCDEGAEVATLNLDRGRWRPHRGSLDVFRCDYEGRLCSACGGYRWKTMAGKCRNCGAYEAIASIALYFVGTVAVVLLLLSLSVTELPGHTMLQRRGGVHVSQRRGLADGAPAPDAAPRADDAPAVERRTARAPRALRNLLAVLATPLGPRRPDSPDRVSAARLEELYRVFRRPLPANGRAEIDRRLSDVPTKL